MRLRTQDSSPLPDVWNRRADGTEIRPTDPDALRALAAAGILEVVQEADDEGDVIYRMLDPDGVRRALDELQQAAKPRP